MTTENQNASENAQHASGASKKRSPILRRKVRVRDASPSVLIAYDLETTRIAKGTPRPLYITAFSESRGFSLSSPVRDIAHLREILLERFLTPENVGARFVAWNGNHFDAYLIAAALILEPGYLIRPFLTRGKNLRGMMVTVPEDLDLPSKQQRYWLFLDGIAMTGLAGVSLAKFLKTFAPDWQKLESAIDFEREEFDALNPDHVAYAMRDSEGLYYGINRAEEILLTYFNEPLGATMGRACIKILTAHIPEQVQIVQPPADVLSVVREYVMRGGYCFCVRSYHGPVYKYDINQAYAAAMRDAMLPAGRSYRTQGLSRFARVYIARVRAEKRGNLVPFYAKAADDRGRVRAYFFRESIPDTWITSIELDQLRAEGWKVDVLESVFFEDQFSLKDYVQKLEHIRTTCEGGPSGAIGTMIKAVGNHSYGKTVEQLDPLELVIAKECPIGFAEYMPEETVTDSLSFPHVFYRKKRDDDGNDVEVTRDYHQPHVGSFITAHVRMVVRRAALLSPETWLYADTDCVMFSSDVTDQMDIDQKRYGAWKLEARGDVYKIIAKKIYASDDGKTRHAKGLNVNRLTADDFDQWFIGKVPEQTQTQRNNFLKVMTGADMFDERKRKGTDAERLRNRR